ncbi:MAG TPA: hypothetical protein EYP65_08560, partial [Armatimonadetes bacterium]|nr:hypothetical protein [Armatimonadota bacterium]
ARLMEEGCYTRADPFFPTETGCNWATIATGASPAVHGCQYNVHLPGDPLDKTVSGFPSHMCKAEKIWQVFSKAGRLSVIFDYPQSFPVDAEKIIHVGEDGYAGPSAKAIDTPRGYRPADVPQTGFHRLYAAKLEVRPQPELSERLGSLAPPLVGDSPVKGVPFKFALLAKEGEAYDTVALLLGDSLEPLAEAKEGKWSNWVLCDFPKEGGGTVKAGFRFKVIRLSKDGRDFLIYRTEIYPQEGFARPEEWTKRLREECGPYLRRPSEQGVVFADSMDIETFYEEWRDNAEWVAKAAETILKKVDWGLFIVKWHAPDYMQHICWHMIDPAHPLHDPERAQEGWEYFARFYGIADWLIGRVWELVGKDGVIAVVTDHGHVANIFVPPLQGWLEEAGLLRRNPDGSINWAETKAFATHIGVWVNLKGRDPQGIVEPGEEYERVREEVIRAALQVREPHTGEPAFQLVARREDLEFMGIGGERFPDVILALRPFPLPFKVSREEYERMVGASMWHIPTGTHGPYLPSAKFSLGTVQALFAASGPGLKRGYRRGRPASLAQVAPTLCKLAQLPPPKDAEFGPIEGFLG